MPSSAKNAAGLTTLLQAESPELASTLQVDRAQVKKWSQLWGRSINFDELAQGQIVSAELMDALAESTGAPARDGLHVHAGLEHVTGYLFSTLVTPYGFKRARWVDGDIERGLGLQESVFLPGKRTDTPLVNLSVLLGSIALQDDSRAQALVSELAPHADRSVRDRLRKGITGRRLLEDTTLEADGKQYPIQLRTDFIPLGGAPNGGNTAMLVYSIRDGRDGRSTLITAFPVKEDFMTRSMDPAGLGPDQEIKLRYNAWVEGWGEPKATIKKGSRSIAPLSLKSDRNVK